MNSTTKFQIGKNGITQGVIDSLSLVLKNHRQVRISALQSSGRDRESIEKIAKEVQSKLEIRCDYRIIGFTIVLTKSSGKNKLQNLKTVRA